MKEGIVLKANIRLMAAALDNFCDAVGWRMVRYTHNVKNERQLHGQVIDEEGNFFEVLGTETGKFYKLLGDKKFELIDQQALLKARKETHIC